MRNLIDGIQDFSKNVFPNKIKLFQELAEGQKPHTLLITCSDSRIDPNLITQTEPGELFVLRNAGNIVPPYGASKGGEEASIEFAIEGLGVKNIVVCGHSKCGAMAALLGKADTSQLPATKLWLDYAAATKKRMTNTSADEHIRCTEENVLVQIQNLKTHPAVSLALAKGKIQIFAWVYHFESGNVHMYQNKIGKYVPVADLKTDQDKHPDLFCL